MRSAVVLNFESETSFASLGFKLTARQFERLEIVPTDDALDVMVANSGGNSVQVLLNDRRGALRKVKPAKSPVGVGAQPAAVAVGDLDRSGDVDAAVANAADGTIQLLLNDGTGAMTPQPAIPVGTGPKAVAVADLDASKGPLTWSWPTRPTGPSSCC